MRSPLPWSPWRTKNEFYLFIVAEVKKHISSLCTQYTKAAPQQAARKSGSGANEGTLS